MQLQVKTIIPENRPSCNEWCKEFNFGARYSKREGIDNALRIMQLWDSYYKVKLLFVNFKTSNDEQY